MADISENNRLILGIFTAVEGAHAFSAFMPSWFTVRKFGTQTQEDINRLRSGYLPAITFNLLLGGTVSGLVKSTWPLLLSAIVTVFMIGMYESAFIMEVNDHG